MECAPHCSVHSYRLHVTKTLCFYSMSQSHRRLKKHQIDSWLYVAGPEFVTVLGLRHGDDDDDDDSEEKVKRIGRRTRKGEERRTKMRRTRKRMMRMMIRIRGKWKGRGASWRASAYLRNGDEGHQQHSDHEVHPEEPAQESEVWRHDGSEVRLYLLDAEFPGDQHVHQIGQLPLQKLPLLEQG